MTKCRGGLARRLSTSSEELAAKRPLLHTDVADWSRINQVLWGIWLQTSHSFGRTGRGVTSLVDERRRLVRKQPGSGQGVARWRPRAMAPWSRTRQMGLRPGQSGQKTASVGKKGSKQPTTPRAPSVKPLGKSPRRLLQDRFSPCRSIHVLHALTQQAGRCCYW